MCDQAASAAPPEPPAPLSNPKRTSCKGVQCERAAYEQATAESGYCYCWTAKHHKPGKRSKDAQWLKLGDAVEFGIFDAADAAHCDCEGDYYGVLCEGGDPDRVQPIGTAEQYVAIFVGGNDVRPWHGYPLWPIIDRSTGCDAKEDLSNDARDKLLECGLISFRAYKKLAKGNHP